VVEAVAPVAAAVGAAARFLALADVAVEVLVALAASAAATLVRHPGVRQATPVIRFQTQTAKHRSVILYRRPTIRQRWQITLSG
jgi:hypothetical protein